MNECILGADRDSQWHAISAAGIMPTTDATSHTTYFICRRSLHLVGKPIHLLFLSVTRVLVHVQQASERAMVVLDHIQGLGLCCGGAIDTHTHRQRQREVDVDVDVSLDMNMNISRQSSERGV